MCGSFCTFETAISAMERLVREGICVLPIMSQNASTVDTRFGRAQDFKHRIRLLCGCDIIDTVVGAEPIGPNKLCDILIIAPCTGNTLAKLAAGITDTAVTMAAKSMLRNGNSVLVAPSTNDGFGASLVNIAALANRKNYFFVPMTADDPVKKPNSLAADYGRLILAVEAAINKKQLSPIIF